MPNWAEGNLRVRGKRENVLNFIQHELVGVQETINTVWDENTLDKDGNPTACNVKRELVPVTIEENCGGESIIIRRPPDTGDTFYFRDSDRQFLFTEDNDIELYFSEGRNLNKDTIVIFEDFNGGWDVDHQYFKTKAVQYKVDIRIFVWELGMCWSAIDTFYRTGRCEFETRQYSDWMWDSPMPHYGG